jgi:glutamyl-tRNA reductase
MDRLVVIGTSFKRTGFVDLSGWTIPVPFRDFAMRELCSTYHVDEAIYMSTCNRSELILWTRDGFSARRITRRWREWAARAGGQLLGPKSDLTVQSGREAARYLFDVAASLDSLVVGETEILRQLRDAYTYSQNKGFAGLKLHKVIQRSLKTGREVRTETSLANLSTSVVSVALKEIRRRMANRPIKKALIIGAGETGGAAARALSSLHVETIAIANRTLENAQELAAQVKGHAYQLDQIPSLLDGCDVIVSAAAVPYTLINPAMIGELSQPLLLVDLAIPANIAPECAQRPMVEVLNLEQLESIAASNKPLLAKELDRAAEIVELGLEKLQGDFKMAAIGPWIKESRVELSNIGDQEIDSIMEDELKALDPEEAAKIRTRLEKMVKRMLHASTQRYKNHARSRPTHEG